MTTAHETEQLRAERRDGRWWLVGPLGSGDLEVVNDFLGYLSDRGYSPQTVRSYAYDLLAFARWLTDEQLGLEQVRTDSLLRFLTFCRTAPLPNQPGGNVISIRSGRATGYAPATVNRTLPVVIPRRRAVEASRTARRRSSPVRQIGVARTTVPDVRSMADGIHVQRQQS